MQYPKLNSVPSDFSFRLSAHAKHFCLKDVETGKILSEEFLYLESRRFKIEQDCLMCTDSYNSGNPEYWLIPKGSVVFVHHNGAIETGIYTNKDCRIVRR